jgi:ribose/xylose/arabinose/galactoside ABC-type transport system permease subunit
MESLGKFIITLGVIFVIFGIVVMFLQKINIPLGNLPGDIKIQRDNFTFYFPLGTSLFISILLTVLLNLLLIVFGKR